MQNVHTVFHERSCVCHSYDCVTFLRVPDQYPIYISIYTYHNCLQGPGSEIQRESGNPFSQRFLSTKLQESKGILINILFYHIKIYGKNPRTLVKFYWENPLRFLHLVANFWPWGLFLPYAWSENGGGGEIWVASFCRQWVLKILGELQITLLQRFLRWGVRSIGPFFPR